jgi:anti-anti-sigma factor
VFTARGLEEALQKSYGKDAGRVIVDLSQCRYIDSSVVAVLIRARKEIICELFVVVQEHSAARRVLDITHVDQLVRIASTLEEAQTECCLD